MSVNSKHNFWFLSDMNSSSHQKILIEQYPFNEMLKIEAVTYIILVNNIGNSIIMFTR
jgi:hypothetical protein